jgi:hypothetical protein
LLNCIQEFLNVSVFAVHANGCVIIASANVWKSTEKLFELTGHAGLLSIPPRRVEAASCLSRGRRRSDCGWRVLELNPPFAVSHFQVNDNGRLAVLSLPLRAPLATRSPFQ